MTHIGVLRQNITNSAFLCSNAKPIWFISNLGFVWTNENLKENIWIKPFINIDKEDNWLKLVVNETIFLMYQICLTSIEFMFRG